MGRPKRYERLPDLLFVEDVAEALRTSTGAVYQMVSRGDLEMAKPGRRLVIPRDEFLAVLRRDMARRAARNNGGTR